jgi:hypothetical protein
MTVREKIERGARPAMRPSGTPAPTAMTRATSASSSVAGMRLRISSTDGTPCTNEVPRSPCSAEATKRPNCTHSGRSSPSRAIACARSAWSASGLIRMSIGLPSA